MRVLLQRTSKVCVVAGEKETPTLGPSILALVGFKTGDTESLLLPMVQKMVHLRIFPDSTQKMNLSLLESGGSLMVVPQFTLYADTKKGRRPGYSQSMPAEEAVKLFDQFVGLCKEKVAQVETGWFGAEMQVHLTNQGPVTMMLDSD